MQVGHMSIQCDKDEYLIQPEHRSAKHYKVLFNGEELHDVVGIIRKKM